MKPDYKNWVPKGLLAAMILTTVISGALLAVTLIFAGGAFKLVASIILGIVCFVFLIFSVYCIAWYNAFSYTGKRKMSKHIIEGVARYVKIPEGGTCLDIGCGSGALTIAVAKRNRKSTVTGLDRWGKEYASFNKPLCEKNAEIEGVSASTNFMQGDACKLDFPDETFDAVTSNYCYHNIPSKDRQAIILETLRVLKKGGCFAIHDIFNPIKYGDMDLLLKKLKDMGYEKVQLIDTTNGQFMTKKEAKFLALTGSAILTGIK